MALTALEKGKAIATPDEIEQEEDASSGPSSSDSSSGSESDSDSETSDSESDEEEITQEYMDSLLEKARRNMAAKARAEETPEDKWQEDEIRLDDTKDPNETPLPPLDPGGLPTPYITFHNSRKAGPSQVRDPDVERAVKASSSQVAPAPPPPPPELSKAGKPLTLKEKKALKNKTAGKAWYDLPAPDAADLPRLYREVEAMRLRNQLDPKRFYRKEEGEGKGIKGLPKHFAIGTIVPDNTPFGAPSGDNLPRASRKRTLVDELVDDAEAKSYAKKKFKELQTVRGARGRNTLHQRNAKRKPKW